MTCPESHIIEGVCRFPMCNEEDQMSPQAETHLKEIKEQAVALLDYKYRAGNEAHGHQGGLWSLTKSQLIDEAINEAVDQLTYLLELKKKLNDGKEGV